MIVAVYILAIICSFSFWLIRFWNKNRKFYELASKIPQIEGHLPLIGHAYKFVGADSKALFKVAKHMTEGGESPRKFWLGHLLFVLVDDPKHLEQILNSKDCLDKPSFFAEFGFKNGLIISNGVLWKSHRKILEPAFKTNVLKSFLPTFNKKSQIFVKVMQERLNGEEFNMFDAVAPLALDNILSTSFGLDKEIQVEKNNEYLKHCIEALHVFITKALKMWLRIKPILWMTKTYEMEQKHVIKGMFQLADEVVTVKKQSLKQNIDEQPVKPLVFIDQLFIKPNAFSTEEIYDEINSIIIAGFETVTTTMSLISLLMALHPDVQEKLYEELQTVFESADEEVTEEKLKQLTYLEMVIKESMRFWQSVPFFARYLKKDMELDGYTIPAGSHFVVPIIHIHRDKKIWGNDAHEFKPERFLPENFAKVPSYGYMPFARGIRNCIGYKYAMKSMMVTLSYFFRSYKVSTSLKLEDVEFEYVIVRKVVPGCMVSIQKREFSTSQI